MTLLQILLMLNLSLSLFSNKIDFPLSDADNWVIINDDVMGGRSSSRAINLENSVRFTGNLSLANNGGFASFRSPFSNSDFSELEGIEIRVRGDGRSYGFSLTSDRRWWRPNHKYTFPTSAKEWTTIKMPLAEFDLLQVGEVVRKGSPSEEFAAIIRMGFILSDKSPGPFNLEIDSVSFY